MFVRNIQYLRAAAAIAVIFVHINVWEQKAVGNFAVTPAWFSFGDAGVDLFFVISGFIMVFIQPSPLLRSRSSYLRFLAHRATRIYPPYWLILIPLFFIWLKAPQLFNNSYHNQVDIWRSVFLLPQRFTPLLMPAWTLIHEVYFYLIVSIALLFGFQGRLRFGTAWFTLVLGGFFLLNPWNHLPISQLIFSPFSLTFLLGYFIGLFRTQISRLPVGIFITLLLAALMILPFSVHYMPHPGVYPNNNHISRFLGYGIPCSFLVAAAVGLEAKTLTLKFLQLLGDASYSIYLVHLPIVSGIYAIVRRLDIHSFWPLVGVAAFCMIGCLTTAVLFHRCIEIHIIRFFRRRVDRMFPSS